MLIEFFHLFEIIFKLVRRVSPSSLLFLAITIAEPVLVFSDLVTVESSYLVLVAFVKEFPSRQIFSECTLS